MKKLIFFFFLLAPSLSWSQDLEVQLKGFGRIQRGNLNGIAAGVGINLSVNLDNYLWIGVEAEGIKRWSSKYYGGTEFGTISTGLHSSYYVTGKANLNSIIGQRVNAPTQLLIGGGAGYTLTHSSQVTWDNTNEYIVGQKYVANAFTGKALLEYRWVPRHSRIGVTLGAELVYYQLDQTRMNPPDAVPGNLDKNQVDFGVKVALLWQPSKTLRRITKPQKSGTSRKRGNPPSKRPTIK